MAIRQKETLFGPLGLWEGIKEAQGFFLFTFLLAEKSLLQGLARRWMAHALKKPPTPGKHKLERGPDIVGEGVVQILDKRSLWVWPGWSWPGAPDYTLEFDGVAGGQEATRHRSLGVLQKDWLSVDPQDTCGCVMPSWGTQMESGWPLQGLPDHMGLGFVSRQCRIVITRRRPQDCRGITSVAGFSHHHASFLNQVSPASSTKKAPDCAHLEEVPREVCLLSTMLNTGRCIWAWEALHW